MYENGHPSLYIIRLFYLISTELVYVWDNFVWVVILKFVYTNVWSIYFKSPDPWISWKLGRVKQLLGDVS